MLLKHSSPQPSSSFPLFWPVSEKSKNGHVCSFQFPELSNSQGSQEAGFQDEGEDTGLPKCACGRCCTKPTTGPQRCAVRPRPADDGRPLDLRDPNYSSGVKGTSLWEGRSAPNCHVLTPKETEESSSTLFPKLLERTHHQLIFRGVNLTRITETLKDEYRFA